ncbi:CPBP family intramembrane glutamic endopeptidase [Brevundimonas sp.]|uniref:CPBP family intramembrane glutamic endopeptidase n=1 Tax=Brevundimonas sp. TaxID=1871086 RepID=UPI003568A5E0
MVQSLRAHFHQALAAAAQSSFTTPFAVNHPWRRLASFVALAVLLMIAATIVVAFVIYAVPGMRDQLGEQGPLPESPLRLIDESSQVATFALILGALSVGILGAAALTYRRPLADFLWPGRRFDAAHLGIGVLAMACVSVVTIPVYLAMGSEWAPPVLDAQYLDRTRVIYVLTMVVGLLAGAAAEEVVCRGVLLRLTGLMTRHPLALCVINGVVFSAIHLDPDPVAFVARAVSGGVWTWAALRLGGLEFAIGAHLANNLAIAMFWEPFSEASTGQEIAWIALAPELATAVVMVVIIERLANRYVDRPPALPARAAA